MFGRQTDSSCVMRLGRRSHRRDGPWVRRNRLYCQSVRAPCLDHGEHMSKTCPNHAGHMPYVCPLHPLGVRGLWAGVEERSGMRGGCRTISTVKICYFYTPMFGTYSNLSGEPFACLKNPYNEQRYEHKRVMHKTHVWLFQIRTH